MPDVWCLRNLGNASDQWVFFWVKSANYPCILMKLSGLTDGQWAYEQSKPLMFFGGHIRGYHPLAFVNSDSCTLFWKIVWTKQCNEMGSREMLRPVGVAAVSDREHNVGSSASQGFRRAGVVQEEKDATARAGRAIATRKRQPQKSGVLIQLFICWRKCRARWKKPAVWIAADWWLESMRHLLLACFRGV